MVKRSVNESFLSLNKKAQGLSTNAIILIILGVVVLVLLIVGFTLGWGSISSYLSSNNVDTIVSACSNACTTNSVYGFCSQQRELVDENKKKTETTCYIFSKVSNFKLYGIAACDIDCGLACNELIINEKTGDDSLAGGTYNMTFIAKGLLPGRGCWIE
jgi:hypothetical protein